MSLEFILIEYHVIKAIVYAIYKASINFFDIPTNTQGWFSLFVLNYIYYCIHIKYVDKSIYG